MAVIQRTGRTNRADAFPRQYMLFSHGIAALSLGRRSTRTSADDLPTFVTVAAMYSPLAVLILASLDTGIPAFFANASAAGVGCPSLYATLTDGPVSCSSTFACAAWMPLARKLRRRGVE